MENPTGVLRHFPLTWGMRRAYRLPSNEEGQPYYFLWRSRGWNACALDRRGVIHAGHTYNPVTVAQYALHLYELLHAGVGRARWPFLAQAEYLLREQRENGGYAYAFAVPRYGLRPGWFSAMAQGQAASVLLRAYWLSRERKYRVAAANAAQLLAIDVAHGGVSFIRNDSVFFEEFAAPHPVHVLNGHLFAAFALWELTKFNVTPHLRELHEHAVDTLERWIHRFDADGWSYYHLGARENERRYAQLLYHQAHVAQLNVYHAMTGRAAFREMALRWRAALHDPQMRAKVWRYGCTWLFTSVRRRIRRLSVPVWMPIDERLRS
jgi:hypothetical protein